MYSIASTRQPITARCGTKTRNHCDFDRKIYSEKFNKMFLFRNEQGGMMRNWWGRISDIGPVYIVELLGNSIEMKFVKTV